MVHELGLITAMGGNEASLGGGGGNGADVKVIKKCDTMFTALYRTLHGHSING